MCLWWPIVVWGTTGVMRSRPLLAALLAVLAGCSSAPQPGAAPVVVEAPAKPPEEYKVRLETNEGPVVIAVHRAWAPRAADHFFDLVTLKFYDGSRFHRVVYPFIAQWGVAARPEINAIWNIARIPDEADLKAKANKLGTVAFAKLGPGSRATQVFINLKDNPNLDKEGFFPFGEVVEGMENVKKLYSFYGEPAPKGKGPDSTRLEREGEKYLSKEFEKLDQIERAAVE
jgi:peptidyl-prolyl cis-trans isomerase A (cyclophilin A)